MKNFRDIDRGWKRIKQEIARAKSLVAKVGVQSDAKHTDKGGSVDMVTVAAVHEFGSKRVPQRAFISTAADSNRAKIAQAVGVQYSNILNGSKDTQLALAYLGQMMESFIKDQITNGSYTALSPKTIKAKKSSKPLIDTGQLRQSIRYVVVGKNEL